MWVWYYRKITNDWGDVARLHSMQSFANPQVNNFKTAPCPKEVQISYISVIYTYNYICNYNIMTYCYPFIVNM